MQQVDPKEFLFRGVTRGQIVPDSRKPNAYRPSSAAFRDVGGCLSVDVASKTSPSESLQRLPQSVALVCFSAAIPIGQGYPVVEDPIEGNPAHALVQSDGRPISKAHCRELALPFTRSLSWTKFTLPCILAA